LLVLFVQVFTAHFEALGDGDGGQVGKGNETVWCATGEESRRCR
jgi:hypothetical protein